MLCFRFLFVVSMGTNFFHTMQIMEGWNMKSIFHVQKTLKKFRTSTFITFKPLMYSSYQAYQVSKCDCICVCVFVFFSNGWHSFNIVFVWAKNHRNGSGKRIIELWQIFRGFSYDKMWMDAKRRQTEVERMGRK